ncbi:MAG: M15 family metallopeptidase [Acidimicrobiales bacterium]
MSPRFDEPTFTVPAVEAFGGAEPLIADHPLPALVDPEPQPVSARIGDELVLVRHRRIRLLSNYWHAGWAHAVTDTFLRLEVCQRLYSVADSLPPGWGLAVFDGWRPLELQQEMYTASLAMPDVEPGFLADPSLDPETPPPHLTGGAVDLTLTWDGVPLAPGTGFDDTTSLAFAAALEDQAGPDRHIRRALFWAMEAQGFVIYPGEWWHFEYGTRRWAAVKGETPFYGPIAP